MPPMVPDPMPAGLMLAGCNAIVEIAERDEHHTDALLQAILRAAWPSPLAQNQ